MRYVQALFDLNLHVFFVTKCCYLLECNNFSFLWLICKENLSADSPVSANKPEVRRRARRTASVSTHDRSDEEDAETEAGQSEMTNDPNALKRMRRYVVANGIQSLDVFIYFLFLWCKTQDVLKQRIRKAVKEKEARTVGRSWISGWFFERRELNTV